MVDRCGQARLMLSEAGDVTAELGKQLLRVQPELLQQVGVLFGVDLIGQLLLGLVDLVALALLLEHFEDLVFGDLHGVPFDRIWV
jgi:hypothetical protein